MSELQKINIYLVAQLRQDRNSPIAKTKRQMFLIEFFDS